MPSISRLTPVLALALALPLLGACTVYTPAEYRYLEETRADSTRVNRAAADSELAPELTPGSNTGERGAWRSVRHASPVATPAALTGEDQRTSQESFPVPSARSVRNEG